MTEVRAKKALGQHFLVDLNIARKICDALCASADPGAGGTGCFAAGNTAYSDPARPEKGVPEGGSPAGTEAGGLSSATLPPCDVLEVG